MFKVSSHVLSRAILEKPETAVRGIIIGRFFLSWDGKPGDFVETVKTSDGLDLT